MKPGTFLAAGAAALLLATSPLAVAQTIYRIVGPNGKMTFTDKPPVESNADRMAASNGGTDPTNGSLPYELRQAMSRFPVVLYTSARCAPCDAARLQLRERGVPFSERTIASGEDVAAFQRLTAITSLPMLTVGTEQLHGYAPSEWAQTLDAAGYPANSALPANYRPAPATPLVPPTKAAPTPEGAPQRAAGSTTTPLPAPGTPTPANPAGIQF